MATPVVVKAPTALCHIYLTTGAVHDSTMIPELMMGKSRIMVHVEHFMRIGGYDFLMYVIYESNCYHNKIVTIVY